MSSALTALQCANITDPRFVHNRVYICENVKDLQHLDFSTNMPLWTLTAAGLAAVRQDLHQVFLKMLYSAVDARYAEVREHIENTRFINVIDVLIKLVAEVQHHDAESRLAISRSIDAVMHTVDALCAKEHDDVLDSSIRSISPVIHAVSFWSFGQHADENLAFTKTYAALVSIPEMVEKVIAAVSRPTFNASDVQHLIVDICR